MTVDELETPAGTALATYVYGVVNAEDVPGVSTSGVGGADVRVLEFKQVAALVSDVPVPIRAKRRELLSHSEVLNEVGRSGTVLPLRFGTTFPDADAVVADFLEPRYGELTSLLEKFEGRVELMVKAFYHEQAILAEIVRDEPRIARLSAITREGPPARMHGERIELGSAVAEALEARTGADARQILDVLRPFALDVWTDDTPIEHQVLRASVLVKRDQVPAVDAALAALAERNTGRIQFKYVGPLPPHSFVSLSPGDGR
jgi:hypothetical protein